MKKLSWRLSKLPTVEELQNLVDDEIITKEEAREVLFANKDEEDVIKAQKQEIKFLKDLVERLSKNPTQIIENIRYIEKPYYVDKYQWYKPYETWCSTTANAYSINADSGSVLTTATGGSNTLSVTDDQVMSFTSI